MRLSAKRAVAFAGSERQLAQPYYGVGNATAFWWQSFMIWDTNPDNPSAVKDHDNAPENGSPHAGPVGAP